MYLAVAISSDFILVFAPVRPAGAARRTDATFHVDTDALAAIDVFTLDGPQTTSADRKSCPRTMTSFRYANF